MTRADALVDFVLASFIQAGLTMEMTAPHRFEVYCDIYRAHALGISLFNMPLEWGEIKPR